MTTTHPDPIAARPRAGGLVLLRPGGPDRHLVRLLVNRDKLARLSTAQASHGLPNAAGTFALMVRVEEEIAARYPKVHGRLFPTWVSQVTRAGHEPGGYNPSCPLCPARPRRSPLSKAA